MQQANGKIVHIVSFNIPYPPDYGGAMDVFYKISALRKLGVGIILHCFTYGRSRSKTLEKECLRVYYYRRNLNLFLLLRKQPFIVTSRESRQLLADLTADNNPIIFEGLHCTAYLNHPSLNGRITFVRTHNIEHLYYRSLARSDRNPLRKMFFITEANKLEKYEESLAGASLLLAISPGDAEYFRAKYGRTLFIGPFHPSDECRSLPGRGNTILLHGDFSTAENNASALFILRDVASRWTYPTIIAGKKPSDELYKAAEDMKHVKIIPNPSQVKMDELVQNAQVCLVPATQATGMKLKLINALWSGRHIIASRAAVTGTGLETLCHLADHADEWVESADRLMLQEFSEAEISRRNPLLRDVADNLSNARKIVESIRNHDVHP